MRTVASDVAGYAPVVKVGPPQRPAEKDLYRKLWTKEEYRKYSPGEHIAEEFLKQAKPKPGATVLDLGCGSGRGGLMLAVMGGMNVTFVDFADNALDEDIKPMLAAQSHVLKFIEADLTKKLPVSAEYGFCTDVLEHIPTEKVNDVLNNCLMAAQHCFFSISTVDDSCGKLVGFPLHLTVKPFEWWLEQFRIRDCVIHWSKNMGPNALFYVSAWATAKDLMDVGKINTADADIRNHVEQNIAGDWNQVSPHEQNDFEVMILGGGPTLNQFEDKIKEFRANGVKLITTNGSYNWALEHGLTPSAQIIVDAREFNKRFTKPIVDSCVYLIASQVHPSVLEGLPKERTYLWHTGAEHISDLLKKQYNDVYYPIPGGSTVLLRTIPLMRMLGYTKFHLFGCDSCLSDEQAHHAFAQPENDSEAIIPCSINGRVFKCHAWMISQAQEFVDLIRVFGDAIELEIYGDGMLKWILDSSANLQDGVKETKIELI